MKVLERFQAFYGSLGSGDVKHLAEIYHPQIVFIDPVATHHGLNEVKAYFAQLLEGIESCQFDIHKIIQCKDDDQRQSIDYLVVWTMHLTTKRLNKGRPVKLDGTSMLGIEEDRISYHRDYYDLGQMIYEQIPLLGSIIKFIRNKMAITA